MNKLCFALVVGLFLGGCAVKKRELGSQVSAVSGGSTLPTGLMATQQKLFLMQALPKALVAHSDNDVSFSLVDANLEPVTGSDYRLELAYDKPADKKAVPEPRLAVAEEKTPRKLSATLDICCAGTWEVRGVLKRKGVAVDSFTFRVEANDDAL